MDAVKKKLLYRSQHMGTKENDAIFGGFATKMIRVLSFSEINAYEKLLASSDQDLYDWVLGIKPLPTHLDRNLLNLIQETVGLKKT